LDILGEEESPDRGGGEQQEAAQGDRGQDPEGSLQLPGQHPRGRDGHSGEDNQPCIFIKLKGQADEVEVGKISYCRLGDNNFFVLNLQDPLLECYIWTYHQYIVCANFI